MRSTSGRGQREPMQMAGSSGKNGKSGSSTNGGPSSAGGPRTLPLSEGEVRLVQEIMGSVAWLKSRWLSAGYRGLMQRMQDFLDQKE